MQLRSGGSWILFCFGFLVMHAPAQSAAPEKFDPADYTKPNLCQKYYEYNETDGDCKSISAEFKEIKKKDCKCPGLKLNGEECVADEETKDAPQCKPWPEYTFKINGARPNAKCSYERKIAVSAPGDYIGDCFYIKAVPQGTSLVEGGRYFVTGQKTTTDDDRMLTLVAGKRTWYHWLGCIADKGPQDKVLASQLMEAGANRSGYAYGILTMPYKYYPSEKSFEVNVPIGGYLGYRFGRAGSGTTAAFAVTLSSVKANTVDPTTLDAAGKPTVTGTTNVAALSGAFGFIFDLLKSPTGKAFKAGVFVGKDIVNDDPSIDYRFNRKTWFAIQLGYDFTDN